jgi:putative DNA primase/helicase
MPDIVCRCGARFTDDAEGKRLYGEHQVWCGRQGAVDLKPADLAQQIMDDNQIVTLSDTGEMLRYERGVYRGGAETVVAAAVEKLKPNATNHDCQEVLGHIRRQTYRDRCEFDSDLYVINLHNGLLDVRSGELDSHDPAYLSRTQLPVDWRPEAHCPGFLKFLCEILPDSDDRRMVLEEMASCLWRSGALQKAYMWVGDGANGKSTLAAVLTALLGERNVSHVTLQSLEVNRFASAELDGKLANIYSDISDSELYHTGRLKSLIAADPIMAERKGKNPFDLRSLGKMIYSANKLPQVQDNTDAFFRRWIITEFKQKFEGEHANPKLIDVLTAPDELSGLLRILVALVGRIIERGGLSRSPTTEQLRSEWGQRADTVAAFIHGCLIANQAGYSGKKDVYAAFVEWCQRQNFLACGNRTFNERLQAKMPIREDVVRIGGRSVKVWRGTQLNPLRAPNLSAKMEPFLCSTQATTATSESHVEDVK